ncbi:MAG: hypothetical protein OQK48_01020 [Sulfurimonas sp.]|uniref:hypothetical protein n=1 Tax=Sulfurimonas sp. TaxID=2022749 RepID=UPI002624F2E0|nr:hypothetical protein [Sulfurimonas sp.]MCW8894390.1 hypothetical protein [Sulfurimonas sp.]MCW8953506.1 hypothetical protein [Sulfurimonas sp.]MCW9068308.1 hypothetical protein [Sulfurimonas sp.]
MDKKIEKILEIWHKRFESENHQYSEFESSDIEYFVGCLLYNHFAFSRALDTMKTIDLSYDFLSECGDEYDEIQDIVKSIEYEKEEEKLDFLQNYIREAKSKYSADELYLLNRLEYHVNAMADRYKSGVDVVQVDFQNLRNR